MGAHRDDNRRPLYLHTFTYRRYKESRESIYTPTLRSLPPPNFRILGRTEHGARTQPTGISTRGDVDNS